MVVRGEGYIYYSDYEGSRECVDIEECLCQLEMKGEPT